MSAKKVKGSLSLPKTVYICTPTIEENDACFFPAALDIDEYGFSPGEVWGEYQLIRKVKPRSEFHLDEA